MLRTIFVFAILVPGLVAALRSRFAALLLYLWFALFRPEEWMWIDISAFRPSLVLGLLVVVPSLLSGTVPNVTHPLSVGALLFMVSALLGQLNAVSPAVGWQWIDYMVRLLVICFLCVSLVRSRERFIALVAVIGGSFGFHTAKAGLMSLASGGVRYGEGLAGAFVDNNGYALGTVMILPFLVVAAQNVKQRWLRYGLWASVPLSMFTVISTYSRGGALAMVVAMVTFVYLQKKRALALVGLGTAALLAVLIVPAPRGYLDRLQTIRTYDQVQDESALGRLHFWRVAVNMVEKRPLGIGLRNYESTYDEFDDSDGLYGRSRAVHSSHFEVLAENGYFGAVVWVGLFVYALRLCGRIRTRSKDPRLGQDDSRFLLTAANGLIVSMTAFIVGGAFIALSLNDVTWLSFSLVAALDRLSLQMLEQTVAVPDAQAARPAILPWPGAGQAARAGVMPLRPAR